jgi:acetoin utilization deacetylase AcuC-like enzyme
VVEASYRAALHATGGACETVQALTRGDARAGFCAMRPSGHDAGPDYAMGFCLFDNVAIAADLAGRELGVARVLIIVWDFHHGNGTEFAPQLILISADHTTQLDGLQSHPI